MFFKLVDLATHVWEVFLSRWHFRTITRFETWGSFGLRNSAFIFACALLTSSNACVVSDSEKRPEDIDISEFIENLKLDEALIEMIADRDGLSPQEAKESARQTLHLAKAYLERQHDSAIIDPARIRHLIRNARVQSWLRENFEATHRPADIPHRVIQKNIDDPNTKLRNFHPKLHFICQAILSPTKENEEPAMEEQWRKSALQFIDPLWRQLSSNRSELKQDTHCKLFKHVVGLSDRTSNDHHRAIRSESFVIDLMVKDRWAQEFVDQVAPVNSPTLIPPFFSKFGLHIVLVSKVLESHLADESLPTEELEQLRSEHLREKIHPAWLRDEFTKQLIELRKSYRVRLASELSHE